MILIITHRSDYTADFVINRLNQQDIPYKRFNCEDVLQFDCSVDISKEFSYSILGENSYTSVWFRRTKIPELQGLSLSDRLYISNEIDTFIKNLLCIIDAKWVSSPFHVYQAENKLFQLKVAKRLGFRVPETLVTNSKAKLTQFYNEQEGNIIIKPIAQTRILEKTEQSFIFTNVVPAVYIEELDKFDVTPSIFQRNISKQYEIRVTVVGNIVFAASVASQDDVETLQDWRRKRLQFEPYQLPVEIEKLCIEIVRTLGLQFGAIDLIKTMNGEYVFLEINPNGQWAWIETHTGQNISQAIVNLLIA